MYKKEKGFTLIEWLISLSLGLCLLTFTTSLYLNLYKTTFWIESEQARHSSFQIALEFLAYDIRMIGFIGYANLSELPLSNADASYAYSMMGWDQGIGTSHFSLPILKEDSDVLYIQYADPNRISVIKAEKNYIKCNKSPSFSKKEILLISDCHHAEIVEWGNIQLKHHYQEEAMISRFERIIYYIAPTQQKMKQKEPTYALYRKNLNKPEQPSALVNHIEKLEFYYAIPIFSHYIKYVKAHQVKDWEKVRAVTVILHFTHPLHRWIKFLTSLSLGYTAHQTTMIRQRSC